MIHMSVVCIKYFIFLVEVSELEFVVGGTTQL